jgi:hypothetical protein
VSAILSEGTSRARCDLADGRAEFVAGPRRIWDISAGVVRAAEADVGEIVLLA